MVLKKENMLNALGQVNLVGNQNYCFYGYAQSTMGQYALLGAFAGLLNKFSGYIINVNENGIGILPMSSMTGKPVFDKAMLLPYGYIAKVEAKKGGLFAYKKISIITTNNECISFRVTKKCLPNPEHLNNINYFLKMYNAL